MFLRFIRNRIILKVFNLCYVLKSPEMLWKNAGAQSPSLINWLGIQPRLEKVMAPHSSTLAWKIPWTEEPGRLQSMWSRRVRHDWATSLSLACIGEGNGNTLQCSCLENFRDGGAWWAAVYGVIQSQTRLKWLSSSSRHVKLHWISKV